MTPEIRNLFAAVKHRHGVLRLNEAGQVVYSGPRLETTLQWKLYEVREELAEALESSTVDTEDVKLSVPIETKPLKHLRPGDVVRLVGTDACLVERVELLEHGRAVVHVVTRGAFEQVWLWQWSNIEMLATSLPEPFSAQVTQPVLEEESHAEHQ